MTNTSQYFQIRNTARLQKFIYKLDKKESASIVYLGGSITSAFHIPNMTDGFSYLLNNALSEQYQTNKLHSHNLGLPGIPSMFGLYQSLQYVEGYTPDVVFIEFAINDMKNAEHQSAFESMVYHCINLPSKPAVVLLLSKSKVGYTCQNYMDMVAEHYHQSSIFISHAVDDLIAHGEGSSWSNFSDDYGHPNVEGHQFIQHLILDFFNQVKLTPLIDEPIPDCSFYDNHLSNFKMLQQSWLYERDSEKTSIEFTLDCKNLIIVYIISDSDRYGDAELYIDGVKVETLSAYRINSWDHAQAHILTLDDKVEEHFIKFKMQKGEENRIFSLLNIGYC